MPHISNVPLKDNFQAEDIWFSICCEYVVDLSLQTMGCHRKKGM